MSSNREEERTEGEKVWKIEKFSKIFKEGNRNKTLVLEMKKGKRIKIKLEN